MNPTKEGFPLWFWLRGANGEDETGSKITYLMNGGTANLLGRGADNLIEFVHRVVRRYPNTILAADSEALYARLVRRYRTNWRSIDSRLPLRENSIGYLVASDSDVFPVTATAWANIETRYRRPDAADATIRAVNRREKTMSKRKNAELTGEAREAAILLAELSGGLSK